jgi:aspartokinase-like uncharacterized kinase
MPVSVCKLGGSLLSLPDLGARLVRLISILAERQLLFIVGGGAAVDVVREWDRLHQLGDERAHWLALRSMMLNESLVLALLPNARLVRTRDESNGRIPVLCTHDFLLAEEQLCDDALPHTWDFTSDSIAAWVAIQWPAPRLVLVKSVPPSFPNAQREGDDAEEEAVDNFFWNVALRVPQVGWVNLRSDKPAIHQLSCAR